MLCGLYGNEGFSLVCFFPIIPAEALCRRHTPEVRRLLTIWRPAQLSGDWTFFGFVSDRWCGLWNRWSVMNEGTRESSGCCLWAERAFTASDPSCRSSGGKVRKWPLHDDEDGSSGNDGVLAGLCGLFCRSCTHQHDTKTRSLLIQSPLYAYRLVFSVYQLIRMWHSRVMCTFYSSGHQMRTYFFNITLPCVKKNPVVFMLFSCTF